MAFEQTQTSTEGYLAQLAEFVAICMLPATIILAQVPENDGWGVAIAVGGAAVILLSLVFAFTLRQREVDEEAERSKRELAADYKLFEGRIAGLEREGVPSSLCADLRELMEKCRLITPGSKFVPEIDRLLNAKGKTQYRDQILRAALVTWQPVVAEQVEPVAQEA